MKSFKRIGVLTSGGDAPGMNAAIRAITRTALASGVEVMGIYRGYSGLIGGDVRPFGVRDVSNIVNRGGTILYSDRCPEFKTEEGIQTAINTCRRLEIDGIIAIGGDGTFRGATDMTNHGIPCIGLPGTIDNDIASTDSTIGFDTAMNTTVEMIDRLRDTCESHARASIIEVMGRHAGDIALQTAVALGATAVGIPEIPFDENDLLNKLIFSRKLGKRNFLVVISEGLGSDYGEAITAKIESITRITSRFTRLGHVVRGGAPSLRDRLLASEMGAFAVEQLLDGVSNVVVCEQAGKIKCVDINYALILDRMYKKTLQDGDLKPYTDEQIYDMEARCGEKRAYVEHLYNLVNKIGL